MHLHRPNKWRRNTQTEDYFCGLQKYRQQKIVAGRQEEPAILISRLLLRMRRMYVASIRLDFY